MSWLIVVVVVVVVVGSGSAIPRICTQVGEEVDLGSSLLLRRVTKLLLQVHSSCAYCHKDWINQSVSYREIEHRIHKSLIHIPPLPLTKALISEN